MPHGEVALHCFHLLVSHMEDFSPKVVKPIRKWGMSFKICLTARETGISRVNEGIYVWGFDVVCAQVHWLVHIYASSITAYYIKMSHASDLYIPSGKVVKSFVSSNIQLPFFVLFPKCVIIIYSCLVQLSSLYIPRIFSNVRQENWRLVGEDD